MRSNYWVNDNMHVTLKCIRQTQDYSDVLHLFYQPSSVQVCQKKPAKPPLYSLATPVKFPATTSRSETNTLDTSPSLPSLWQSWASQPFVSVSFAVLAFWPLSLCHSATCHLASFAILSLCHLATLTFFFLCHYVIIPPLIRRPSASSATLPLCHSATCHNATSASSAFSASFDTSPTLALCLHCQPATPPFCHCAFPPLCLFCHCATLLLCLLCHPAPLLFWPHFCEEKRNETSRANEPCDDLIRIGIFRHWLMSPFTFRYFCFCARFYGTICYDSSRLIYLSCSLGLGIG